MAEVFGVVAGAIALLHLSAKAAEILQGIRDIEDDFQELCEEIENISSWIIHAKSTIPSIAKVAPIVQSQLAQIARKLENIAKELKGIEDRLKKETADGSFKVNKAKWLIKSDKIAKMLQKARYAKADLALAIQWQQHAQLNHIMEVSTGISQNLVRGEQMMSATLRHVTILADNLPPNELSLREQQRVEELPDSWTEADEKDAGQGSGKQISNDRGRVAADRSSSNMRRVTTVSTVLTQRMKPSCPEDCGCGCHANLGQRQKSSSMSSLFAYLGVHYDMPSRGKQLDPRCKCLGNWQMEYRPPWLRARVLVLSGSYHAAWPMVSLRTARVLLWDNFLWGSITKSAQRMRYVITNGAVVYPDDRSETGREIVEQVISLQNYDVLELLLEEWRNVLPRQGLSKRAGWEANRSIETIGNKLDERHLRLLQQVVSFAEMDDELVTSKVHEAAKQGQGMAEALTEEGWAKDALDHTGRSPLHWAAFRGHADSLQQLIAVGADVNFQDMGGLTPLMLAALNNQTDCMRQLLVANCRIDQRNHSSRTALHMAAGYGSAIAVRLLLTSDQGRARARAMAAVATEHAFGRLPLHELAFSAENATPEEIEETARLLLDAHPEGIESPNALWQTPLCTAVISDNLPLVRCLIRAGAALTAVDHNSYNILHHAVVYSTTATLNFLLEEGLAPKIQKENQPLNIDHELRNKNGGTPWDAFIFFMHTPPWRLGDSRHLTAHTQSAFVDLYQHIRDRNLRHDISVLQNALDDLSQHDHGAARAHLSNLAMYKADKSSAGLYRAFAQQIDAGEIEAATAGIGQDLKDLHDELESSPWDQSSTYDHLASKSQWYEISDNSFWVEPADAFVVQDSKGLASKDEEEGKCLDYARVTRIYSDRGHMLYDSEDAEYGPREFFQQYIEDFSKEESREESEEVS